MDDTRLGQFIRWLATAVAIAGGAVLVLITIMTVISVIGRALIPLGLSPVKGDYELVQTGVLFAIFCSLPLTQYAHGHADVAVLTDYLPVRANAIIELVMDMLMLGASLFILWRFWIGLLDKFGNHETTFVLHMPVWVSYAAGMLGAVTMLIVAAYCVARSFANTISAQPKKPEQGLF
jgi:TRAP-type C4-dicarboxylate transport system permease small subunit